jgi:hypothetical protein
MRAPGRAALSILACLAAGPGLAAGAAGAAAPAAPDVLGTYRLRCRALIDARPFPARDEELHADAVLVRGGGASEIRLRLAGDGFACDLAAKLGADGALAFAPGQRCVADLRSDEVDGRVEARLRAGTGRVHEDVLTLDLAFTLTGSVQVRSGGALDALSAVVPVPGAGGEPVPVSGEARGRGEGRRDRSRAAE